MSEERLERLYRDDWGRLLAILIARYRDLDVAEESLADAFESAARTWPASGVPDSPAAWVMTAAQRSALDRFRRRATAARALPLLVSDAREQTEVREAAGPLEDSELRLLLLSCHPALAPNAQAALSLRLLLGIPTVEIARLFLTSEATMAARITRAKRKIHSAGIPLAMPPDDRLSERLTGALDTIYLCFTAGYAPGFGDDVLRADLSGEAIRLARLLWSLMMGRADGSARQAVTHLRALLALMLLQHARRRARVNAAGELVLLADQDRSLWVRSEIDEGLSLLATVAPGGGRVEEVRLQAEIASHHMRVPHPRDTDWPSIVRLYERLETLTGSPIVRLNRAVAVAESGDLERALLLLDGLDEWLPNSHRVPAVRGELLARRGDVAGALEQWAAALDRCRNGAERDFLAERIRDLSP